MKILFDYSGTAGSSGDPPQSWPVDSSIPAPHDSAVLVMFAHPQCPCSRASISELAKIMARRQSKLKSYVLFLRPKTFSEDWTHSDLWSSAAAIPGVTPIIDYDGQLAKRYRVSVSGHTLLYGQNGNLVFSGGITGARGHEGDNQGEDLIVENLDHPGTHVASTLVFGCSLTDEANTIDAQNKTEPNKTDKNRTGKKNTDKTSQKHDTSSTASTN